MTHLSSRWRDPRITPMALDDLTPMDLHLDNRYLTRDLPRIVDSGLWYPLMVYRADPDWWFNVWARVRGDTIQHNDPVIQPDGTIWAVKMGSNRWQVAKHLQYTTIDAIMCEDSNECAKLGRWFAQCDPLNNPDAMPYLGLYDYEHLTKKV